MSDLSYTPTRQMAQSAAMKAQDAYAMARDALGKVEAARAAGIEEDILIAVDELKSQVRAFGVSLARLEARLLAVEKPATVRVVARKAKA